MSAVHPVEPPAGHGQERRRSRTSLASQSSPSDLDALGKELAKAKSAGRVLRLRISGSAGSLGLAMIVVGMLCASLLPTGHIVQIVGVSITVPGIVILLFAILPSDAVVIKVSGGLGTLVLTVCVYTWARSAAEMTRIIGSETCQYSPTEEKALPMWFCKWTLAFWTLSAIMAVVFAAAFAHACVRLAPRASLDRQLRFVGLFLLGMAVLRLVDFPLAIAAKRQLNDGKDVAKGLELFFLIGCGCFVSWPAVRLRVHAALAARGGEAVGAAAGIAAMMGNRSAARVRTLGAARLRSVPLSELTLAHLESNKPDPKLELYHSVAKAARVGEVDAFVRCGG